LKKSKTVKGIEAIRADLAQRFGIDARVQINVHGIGEPLAAQIGQELAQELGAEREHFKVMDGAGNPVQWYKVDAENKSIHVTAFYKAQEASPCEG
jgi:hypothetical protein